MTRTALTALGALALLLTVAAPARAYDPDQAFMQGSIVISPEVAYGAHPWARGRGVMERAVRMLIEWGFKAERLNTIEWLSPRGNWPSWRLAWKLGFTYEGVLPNWLSQRGKLVDGWVGILRRGEAMLPRAPWLESPTLVGTSLVLRKRVGRRAG